MAVKLDTRMLWLQNASQENPFLISQVHWVKTLTSQVFNFFLNIITITNTWENWLFSHTKLCQQNMLVRIKYHFTRDACFKKQKIDINKPCPVSCSDRQLSYLRQANNKVQLTLILPQVVIRLTAGVLLPSSTQCSRLKSEWMGSELCDRTSEHLSLSAMTGKTFSSLPHFLTNEHASFSFLHPPKAHTYISSQLTYRHMHAHTYVTLHEKTLTK